MSAVAEEVVGVGAEWEFDYLLLDALAPRADNPRVWGSDDAADDGLVSLAESIRAQGVLEPILVRRLEAGGRRPEEAGPRDAGPTEELEEDGPRDAGFTEEPERSQAEYEIVCGERRWRAARMAGLAEIPALVREMSHERAFEIMITENLQREDLHPLEEAAGIQAMLDRGWTLDQASNQLGRSRFWVARRARLSKLSKTWRKRALDPESNTESWSASHFEVIARFPEDVQESLAEHELDEGEWLMDFTVHDLKRRLASWLRLIESAPWFRKEKKAGGCRPETGEGGGEQDEQDREPTACGVLCSECLKRSDSQPELWDAAEVAPGKRKGCTGARCLDLECWDAKMHVYLTGYEEELREKYGCDVTPLIGERGLSWQLQDTPWEKTAVFRNSPKWEACKKKDEGAVPCLIVCGEGVGELVWMRKKGAAGAAAEEPKEDGNHEGHEGHEGTEDKVLDPDEARRRGVLERVMAVVEGELERLEEDGPRDAGPTKEPEGLRVRAIPDEALLAFAAVIGMDYGGLKDNLCFSDAAPEKVWPAVSDLACSVASWLDEGGSSDAPEKLRKPLLESSLEVVLNRLRSCLDGGEVNACELESVCVFLGLDYGALWEEAEEGARE